MLRRTGHDSAEGDASSSGHPTTTRVTVGSPTIDKHHAATVASAAETTVITVAHIPRLLAFLVASSFVTALFALHVHNSPKVYQYGDLYAGQVFAFLVGFAILLAAGLFYASSLVVMLTSTCTFEEAQNRTLDAHSAAGLKAAAEFTLLLGTFFLCDRTTLIPRAKKNPNSDTFWFLWLMLMVAGFLTLRRAKAPPAPVALAAAEEGSAAALAAESADPENFHVKWLQRDQTEEWKGWMQIMFLWYHYFEAKELYNVIRLYIAAYVWMTGFGNFSYYYIRKDFSLERFCQMQWRLNFMVVWVCLLLANEYMLYYINMLHTYFTLLIYVGLGVASHMNVTSTGVAIKVAVLFTFCYFMWDVKGVFELVWRPFTFLVQYHDPYKADRPVLHEWEFRSGLDHFIWIVGMITAFNHPNVDAWMVKLDNMGRQGHVLKAAVTSALALLGWWYVKVVLMLPKKEYNAIHPYTSFIPITIYILLRNMYPVLRRYHMHLFEYLGKITLETYIAQFHVWMATTGINGSPKFLLRVLPEKWPLLNFAIMSAVFFVVSLRLFHNTNSLKSFILPAKLSAETLRKNLVIAAIAMAVVYLWAVVLHAVITSMAASS